MHDHRTVFGTVERDYWTEAAGLKPDERALIERYLDRDASTLEAGTGGGRILGEMRELGFTALVGFDFVPELIAEARRNEPSGEIGFDVQDATRLAYQDASFDQVIYLQQLLSSIEDAPDRGRVLAEAFRILKPGGMALFSVLPFEVRASSARHRPYLLYLRALRRLRGASRPEQLLPRLRMRGRPSAGALRDTGPHVYWYRAEEIDAELAATGFEIAAIGTTPQVVSGRMPSSAGALGAEDLAGTLYVACSRPANA
jgi:ubiquinone/menaquinone biosynthesis C-methylase UbiE